MSEPSLIINKDGEVWTSDNGQFELQDAPQLVYGSSIDSNLAVTTDGGLVDLLEFQYLELGIDGEVKQCVKCKGWNSDVEDDRYLILDTRGRLYEFDIGSNRDRTRFAYDHVLIEEDIEAIVPSIEGDRILVLTSDGEWLAYHYYYRVDPEDSGPNVDEVDPDEQEGYRLIEVDLPGVRLPAADRGSIILDNGTAYWPYWEYGMGIYGDDRQLVMRSNSDANMKFIDACEQVNIDPDQALDRDDEFYYHSPGIGIGEDRQLYPIHGKMVVGTLRRNMRTNQEQLYQDYNPEPRVPIEPDLAPWLELAIFDYKTYAINHEGHAYLVQRNRGELRPTYELIDVDIPLEVLGFRVNVKSARRAY